MNSTPLHEYALDELVAIEDALEAMQDGSCGCGKDYVALHKRDHRSLASAAWVNAIHCVTANGTAQKALNAVRREIEAYR